MFKTFAGISGICLLLALAYAYWQAPTRAAEDDDASIRLAQQRSGPAPAPRPTKPSRTSEPVAPPAAAQSPQPDNKEKAEEVGWTSRCVSDARQGGLDCSVEQSATLTKTGQLFAAVTIRVPSDTRQPVMMVQLPVGIFLPKGVSLQIDQQAAVPLVVQTCDLKGCYAGLQLQAETIAALKTGKRLVISFQTLTKEDIAVSFVLDKFPEAFGKIE